MELGVFVWTWNCYVRGMTDLTPIRFRVLLSVLAWLAAPAAAATEPPVLGLPIACTPGTDCWVVNLVDLDPGPGVRDYACTKHSYDGHKGTDIAIRDLAVMRRGVPVIASAPGVVTGVRDGMKDVDVSIAGRQSVKGRDCGNGVLVRLAGGWETQYCHLRRGSVAVRKGDRVAAGQKLGLVGLSGMTEYPHVHLSVRYQGRVVDPFVGPSPTNSCGIGPGSLWAKPLRGKLDTGQTALYNVGFAPGPPKAKTVRAGRYDGKALSRSSPALVLWADIYWVHVGDRITFRVRGPDGRVVVERTAAVPKTLARRLFFAGKKRKQLYWPTGTYRGEAVLVRADGTAGPKTLRATRTIDIR